MVCKEGLHLNPLSQSRLCLSELVNHLYRSQNLLGIAVALSSHRVHEQQICCLHSTIDILTQQAVVISIQASQACSACTPYS